MYSWRHINRKRIKHIRASGRFLSRQFASIRSDLKAELDGHQSPESLLEVAKDFRINQQVIWDAYYRIYQDTGIEFADMNYSKLQGKKGREIHRIKKDINDAIRRSVWFNKLMEYVDSECGSIIQDTTRSLYRGIVKNTTKAIAEGVEAGWGVRKITSRILELQGQMDGYRAERIARTEVMRASNEGAFMGASDSGVETLKFWISGGGKRDHRPEHLAANGQERDMNEPFNIMGEDIMYPGDPSASPENTINCTCAIAFEPKERLIY